MRRFFGRIALALAALLLIAKFGAVSLDPSSLSTRAVPNLWLALVFFVLLKTGRRLARGSRDESARVLRSALVLLLGALTTGFIVMIAWVDRGLAQRSYEGVVNDPYKIWGARGLVVEGPNITADGTQNSIESVSLAFERGAKGTEVDVYFDAELGHFIVSHDRPYNKKNGKLLTLRELLAATGQGGAFWLDWKKLRHLDAQQLEVARAELDESTAPGGLKERFYVEGEDPINLSFFKRAGFKTIFDTQPLSDANPLTTLIVDAYKAAYYFGGFTVLGMNTGTAEKPIYGPETRRLLRNVPAFVYHAPDDAEFLNGLLASPDVRVILVQNHSLDRYGMRAGAADTK
ncbi:MAG: hypothetical protein R3F49_12570 [Planctomycetota bacterium]